jgi:hypothetical protein
MIAGMEMEQALWNVNATFDASFAAKKRLPTPTIRPMPQELSSNSLPVSAAIGFRPNDNSFGTDIWRDVSFRYRVISKEDLDFIDQFDVIGDGAVFKEFQVNDPIEVSEGAMNFPIYFNVR